MSYQVNLTLKSRNAKTGPIPVSTTTAKTCPDACPFKKGPDGSGGCYADGGPLAIVWRGVTEGTRGDTWAAFLDKVRNLPGGILWRHNQAGDLPGNARTLDRNACRELTTANKGKNGFTYTHYDVVENRQNRETVAKMNRHGFAVNLSGNNLTHADALADTGAGPVVAVLPAEVDGSQTPTLETPAGRRVVVCPATYKESGAGSSCATCGLCARINRKSIVGFPAHGVAKRKASRVAQG